jgi:F-type H+-transporting ATPase subunit gamma
MANTKEVRKQIASIKGTQKITSAMEMVAASKMKKTQDGMLEGRPYSLKIKEVISHIASASSEYNHPFMKRGSQRKRALLLSLQTKVCAEA